LIYIGILLGAHPILRNSRIRVKNGKLRYKQNSLSSTDAGDSTNRKDTVTRYFIFHALKANTH
jgi:hypothetical protein